MQGESESGSRMAYLTASCIHQIFSLGSGDRQLYHLADRSRAILFSELRSLKLGATPNTQGRDRRWPTFPTIDSTKSVQGQWEYWLEQEKLKRLAWAAFEYDCSLCILTNRRAAVDLSEIPKTFPCAEALWQARTASTWKALMSHMSKNATDASTQSIILGLLAGHAPPSDLPFWARRLSAQLISRQLWDTKQSETAYMFESFTLPSAREAQLETRAHLLSGLQILAESVASPTDVSGLLNSHITMLISHYSHLHAHSDLLDLLVYVVRSSVQSPLSEPLSTTTATQKLAAGLEGHPQQSRHLAWHAAQIVAIARKFLVPAPCEILRVFMGYTFLMAFARYGPHGPYLPHLQELDDQICVRLDVIHPSPEQKGITERWVLHGGRAAVGPIENICDKDAFSEIKQQALQTLDSLRHWGLAERFSSVLTVFDFEQANSRGLDTIGK